MKIFLLLAVFLITNCGNLLFPEYREYIEYSPVYESKEDYQQSLAKKGEQKMDSIGRIYHYGKYQIINEVDKGIHIVDNQDPANPLYLVFYCIPGNKDVAIKGDILYADSYSNLLTLEFNPLDLKVLHITEDAFPPVYQHGHLMLDPEKGHVKEWKTKRVREKVRSNVFVDEDVMATGANAEASQTGTAGSLSRFALGDGYLYAVNESQLQLFDISFPARPKVWTRSYVGWGLETIFKKDSYLYLGSMSAMYIYEISQPGNPVYLSEFFHATSCDPVVVEGGYAYVTLRSGSPCRGGDNQLNIIDISDPSQPMLTASYAMLNPHGLGIKDSILFICEGSHGLKIFNVADPENLSKLAYLDGIQAIDIIIEDDIASVIGNHNVYQYQITEPANPELISQIAIVSQE